VGSSGERSSQHGKEHTAGTAAASQRAGEVDCLNMTQSTNLSGERRLGKSSMARRDLGKRCA
jgi:hypothetical protein